MHQPITILLLMTHALCSPEFPAQDRAITQVAGTDAGAPIEYESPVAPDRASNTSAPCGITPTAPELGPRLTDIQLRDARQILDTLIAFASVSTSSRSTWSTSKKLGLNNSSVWRWMRKLRAADLTLPASIDSVTTDELLRLLQALARKHKPGGRVKYPLTEHEALALRACVLARSTQDATHFKLAVEDFANHPTCTTATRALIVDELDRSARKQRMPNWPLSIRRAGMPTVQESAWFRGRKHAQEVEQVDRRGCYIIAEDGSRIDLRPHRIWEMDDESDNEPRRSTDPDSGEQIITRQALWTQDVYSAALLGLTQVARARDAYRTEDVADHTLRCVEAWGLPDFMRLEMGDIWAGRFFHGFVPTEPGTTHTLPGWPADERWGGFSPLCRIVNVHKSKGKVIEAAFNLKQALSAHASLSIGRTRGEFEEATRALVSSHRNAHVDERFWSMDRSPEISAAVAERFNLTPKIRRMFGRDAIAPSDLLRSARGMALLPSEAWRFCPVKRTATIRGGHVEVSVDHYPRPFRFRVNGVNDLLHLDHGYTVLIAFHPGRPAAGCWVFNAELDARNRDGLRRGEKLLLAPHAEDVPQIDLSRAGDFGPRKKANAAVRRAFRAIGQAVKLDYAQDSNGKQLTVRQDDAGRSVESDPPLRDASVDTAEPVRRHGRMPAAPNADEFARRRARIAEDAALARELT